jgi:hypothetical protein
MRRNMSIVMQNHAVRKISRWFRYWHMLQWQRIERLRRTLWRNWGWKQWKRHHALHQRRLLVNWTHGVRMYNRSLLHRLPDHDHVAVRNAAWMLKKRMHTWVSREHTLQQLLVAVNATGALMCARACRCCAFVGSLRCAPP